MSLRSASVWRLVNLARVDLGKGPHLGDESQI